MIKYNDENIFIGYIKQLLSSFNYPDMDIYSDRIIPIKNNYYLKNNSIYWYDGEKLNEKFIYTGNNINNITKSLKNTSFIYDNDTHVWLGNYLRFLRDYKNLNLISLYNCFTNVMASELNIEKYRFDSNDSNHAIYEIPVKLFQTYSIYVGCSGKVEIICNFKNNNEDLNTTTNNYTYTYKVNSLFKEPILFDKLSKKSLETLPSYQVENMYNLKDDLYLYIKLPVSNVSSIVILEGTYNNSNDYILNVDGFKMLHNYSVNNYKDGDEENKNMDKIPLISPLELIYINSGESYPFADRLIEYLVYNAITPLETIDDNIKRIQSLLMERFQDYKKTKDEEGNIIFVENKDGEKIHNKLGIESFGTNYGKWIPKMRNVFYDIMMINGQLEDKKDILGYCDKDVENILGKDVDIYTTKTGGYDL